MFKYDENVEGRYGIKLVGDRIIRKEAGFGDRVAFNLIRRIVNHFIAFPSPLVVPVYRFEVLEEHDNMNGNWGTYKYAYEMRRLCMLSREEKTVINRVFRHVTPIKRDNPDPEIQACWKEFPQLVEFMNAVLTEGRYNDLHDGNFLKDENGDYKIIDLEGFMKYPLDGPQNDWVTK